MKIQFYLPEEVVVQGRTITQADLKVALRDEDFTLLRPLITLITQANGSEREELFNFFIGGIQFAVERCVRNLYQFFDKDFQEEIFWQGIAYVWENLGKFDETKKSLHSWIWDQVKYGSRDARRREKRAKELLVKCQNNPALLAAEVLFETSRQDGGFSSRGGGVAITTLESSIGRDLNEHSIQEQRAMRDAMNSLKEKERMLIWLKVVEGLSVEEIAERLGNEVSKDAVYKACNRAQKKLASQFTDKMMSERAKNI